MASYKIKANSSLLILGPLIFLLYLNDRARAVDRDLLL